MPGSAIIVAVRLCGAHRRSRQAPQRVAADRFADDPAVPDEQRQLLPLDPGDLAVIVKALTNGIALEQMAAPGTIDDDLLMRALQLLAG